MGTRLFVGNLPFSATEDEIREMLGAFGPVHSVALPTDRDTGRPRGFGEGPEGPIEHPTRDLTYRVDGFVDDLGEPRALAPARRPRLADSGAAPAGPPALGGGRAAAAGAGGGPRPSPGGRLELYRRLSPHRVVSVAVFTGRTGIGRRRHCRRNW